MKLLLNTSLIGESSNQARATDAVQSLIAGNPDHYRPLLHDVLSQFNKDLEPRILFIPGPSGAGDPDANVIVRALEPEDSPVALTESESLRHYGPHCLPVPMVAGRRSHEEWSCAMVIVAGMMFVIAMTAMMIWATS